MLARILAIALLVLTATGCAPTTEPAPLLVDVTQGRSDRDGRVIVMDVTNTASTSIELVRVELVTGQFAEPAVWNRGTELAPGRTVSLRAPLADPICPSPTEPHLSVEVTFVDETGAVHTQSIAPSQSTGVLAIIARDDCFAALAAEAATIRVAGPALWVAGAGSPAELAVEVTPTGTGSLDFVEARSTVLLSLVDATGAPTEALPLYVAVRPGADGQRLSLRLVPSRCDPHAIAEDKRGTIMLLEVRLHGGEEGLVFIPADDSTKADLFAYIADYCATI